MTGDELFDRMKNKEIGVILESHEDAEQLAVLLQGIPYADELVEWYDHRNARVIVNSNDGFKDAGSEEDDFVWSSDMCEHILSSPNVFVESIEDFV